MSSGDDKLDADLGNEESTQNPGSLDELASDVQLDKSSLDADSAEGTRRLVVKLGPHDVLVGRGAPANVQNKTFRKLVKERQGDYVSTRDRYVKNQMVADIIKTISDLGGKFVRKIDGMSPADTADTQITAGTNAWLEEPLETAVRKTKQALRDKWPPSVPDNKNNEDGDQLDDTLTNDRMKEYAGLRLSDLFHEQQGAALLCEDDPAPSTSSNRYPLDSKSLHQNELQSPSLPDTSYETRLLGPDVLSRLHTRLQLSQQRALDENIRASLSLFAPGTLQARSNMSILSALAQQQGLFREAQQPTTLGSFLCSRLLANQNMSPVPTQGLRGERGHTIVSSARMGTLLQAGLSTPAISTTSMQMTKAETSLQLASFNRLSGQGQLELTEFELYLLRVLACHGLPVWLSDMKDAFHLQGDSASERKFSWRDFASCLNQLVERGAANPSPIVSGNDKSGIKLLAERVVMLLERLLIYSSIAEAAFHEFHDQTSELSMIQWFRAELSRWASQLNLMDDNRNRPFAFSTQDLRDVHRTTAESCAGALTKESCINIISQVAGMTRLRSIDIKNPNCLDDMIGEVYFRTSSHANRTQFINGERQSVVKRNTLLVNSLLEIGLSGQLLDDLVPDISTLIVQTHIENLIGRLHAVQADKDNQRLVGKRKEHLQDPSQDARSHQGTDPMPPLFKRQRYSP